MPVERMKTMAGLYVFTRQYQTETGAAVHLALENAAGAAPLNHGFGVLFPRADFETDTFVGKSVGLRLPYVIKAPAGGYLLLALPCCFEKGKAVAGDRAHGIIWFETADFCGYEEKGFAPLAPAGTVLEDVRAARAGEAVLLYALYGGGWHCFETKDMQRFVPVAPGDIPLRHSIGCADAAPACRVEIDEELAEKLVRLFTAPALPGDAVRFPFPLMEERGDPMAIRWKEGYLFAATDDEQGQRKLKLRWARTLKEIPAAKDHVIFHSPQTGDYSGCLWAPELHVVDGRLCLFFAAGMPHWYTVQSRVMWLEGEDPLRPECWSRPRRMETPSGDWLTHTGITLDMTVVPTKLGSYVIWSQRVIETEPALRCGTADLMIARLNTKAPWKLETEPVLLSRPEYGWERIHSEVLEGPFLLRRGEMLHVTYAAALIDHTYAVGMLSIRDGEDPLQPGNWRKCPWPLVHRLSMPDQIGAGHNAFVKDEKGNDVLLIHALSKENYLHDPTDGRRYPCFRQVVWDEDDFPHLDAR